MGRSAGSGITVAFGAAVRSVRNERGISQERLAEVAGLHRTYIGDIERGERNLSLINIERLALALGIRPSELLARAETLSQS